MTGPDRRSVGELLLECDLTARRLLLDPDALDTAPMVRVWPELVQAGHEFLAALPGPSTRRDPGLPGIQTPADPAGERLHLMAIALNDTLRPRSWPSAGPADERLLAITGNLVRAHDLLERGLRTSAPPSAAVQADAAAARTRVLHVLYVTAHGISLAAGADARALQSNSRSVQRRRSAVYKLSALKLIGAHLDTFEQVVGAEVYRSFPSALAGERREEAAPDRLRTAFATWQVETHRALVRQPTMANIAELTRVQTSTIALTRVLLDAAARCGLLDSVASRGGLEPALAAADSAWGNLHATARDLTASATRSVARDLRVAGSELIHALAELTLNGTSVADDSTLADRVRLNDVPATIMRALDAHREVSQPLLDAALDPRLSVNAFAAQRVISDLSSRSLETTSPNEPWLAPRDIAFSRDVPLPAPVRDHLGRQVADVDKASRSVATAAADFARAMPLAMAATKLEGNETPLRSAPREAVIAPSRPRISR